MRSETHGYRKAWHPGQRPQHARSTRTSEARAEVRVERHGFSNQRGHKQGVEPAEHLEYRSRSVNALRCRTGVVRGRQCEVTPQALLLARVDQLLQPFTSDELLMDRRDLAAQYRTGDVGVRVVRPSRGGDLHAGAPQHAQRLLETLRCLRSARRSPVVEWEHPQPETVSPYTALKYEFVAGRGSVVWIMTGDGLQAPAAILHAVRQGSDLVHAPGQFQRAGAADRSQGRPQSRDPAIAGGGHDASPCLGTQGKRRQPGRHGTG